MPRIILPIAIASALVSAFFLYGIKHDTRALEASVQANERAIDKAITDIAVLKAERAHLARPERIEPLARALGFGPPTPRQIVQTDVNAGDGTTTGGLRVSAGPNAGPAQ